MVQRGKLTARLERVGNVLKQPYAKVRGSARHVLHVDMVPELMRDFQDAISAERKDYYLGAIVLEEGVNGELTLRDGRKRLMVMSILLDRVRDGLTGTKGKLRRGYVRDAVQCIDEFLEDLLTSISKPARATLLRRWLAFVERCVMVSVVTAPPEVFLRYFGSLSTQREVRRDPQAAR